MVTARFELDLGQPGAGFFDQPWPSALRRQPDGHVDVTNFPGHEGFFGRYVELAARTLEGESLSPTMYVRLTAPVDAPAQPERGAQAPIFLVDVDPASPERGVFFPLSVKRPAAGSRLVPAETLEIRVRPGFVLRPATRYALVVRRSLVPSLLGTELGFEASKGTSPRSDPRHEAVRRQMAPVHAALAALGVRREDTAMVVPLLTHEPRAFTAALIEHAASLTGALAPRVTETRWDPTLDLPQGPGAYRVVRGVYCTPNYQQELARSPFLDGGGEIARDPQGHPVLAPIPNAAARPTCGGLLPARFLLSVPLRPAPPGGYPLVVSAHGTGGDAGSFLGDQDFAGWAARQGLAVVSTDQPIHGANSEAPRPGSTARISIGVLDLLGIKLPIDPPMLFYNPLNPAASRDNARQATVDAAVLGRLFAGLDLARLGLPPGPGGETPPRLRAGPFQLAGHSQGSQSLAVLGAIDPQVAGVVLSGSGGDVRYGVLGNREFARFRGVVEGLVGVAPGELDEYHPLLALVQAMSDAIDPQSYASLYRAPWPGRAPRSVLHFEGLNDRYNPNAAAEALAVALRATPLAPLPHAVPGLALLGLTPQPEVGPRLLDGRATAAFVQLAPTQGEDGHFVIYREPQAGPLIEQFFAQVAAGQPPRLRFP
ncbi:MAG: hypothetical protein EOO75_06810 [Myxococcales bacterium]|nr:MAG: hypothetical protein EOO75_06810 [Myxococcales bacterium]